LHFAQLDHASHRYADLIGLPACSTPQLLIRLHRTLNALRVMRTAGAKLVVCTNKPTALSHSLLTKLGMIDLFDGIVGIDAVTAAKPDAAHLIEAVQAVGGDLNHTIMVGDADTDAGTARAAGTPLILVDFGYTEIPAVELAPDILLHHFDDLVDACTDLFNKSHP
ncbi:HAD-IA family hydrolase, partial [Ralstonia pseudosolanacearum]